MFNPKINQIMKTKKNQTEALDLDDLNFEKVDTGEFQFFNFEETPVFIGKLSHECAKDENDEIRELKGLVAHDMQGKRFIIPEYYKVMKFFYSHYNGEICKIVYTGTREIAPNKTVKLFDIYKAK